jgi:hypothetical protein
MKACGLFSRDQGYISSFTRARVIGSVSSTK